MNRRSTAGFLSAAALAFALAGCTSMSGAPPMSDPMPPAMSQCHADGLQSFVGQAATPQLLESARQRAGARVVRVLRPDQMVTMEFREDRLSVHVDAANVVTRIVCG